MFSNYYQTVKKMWTSGETFQYAEECFARFFEKTIIGDANEPGFVEGRLPFDPAGDSGRIFSAPILQPVKNDLRICFYDDSDQLWIAFFCERQVLSRTIDDNMEPAYHPVIYFFADTII